MSGALENTEHTIHNFDEILPRDKHTDNWLNSQPMFRFSGTDPNSLFDALAYLPNPDRYPNMYLDGKFNPENPRLQRNAEDAYPYQMNAINNIMQLLQNAFRQKKK